MKATGLRLTLKGSGAPSTHRPSTLSPTSLAELWGAQTHSSHSLCSGGLLTSSPNGQTLKQLSWLGQCATAGPREDGGQSRASENEEDSVQGTGEEVKAFRRSYGVQVPRSESLENSVLFRSTGGQTQSR